MKSSLRIPHPHTTLHLYRHLLRESSYLPSVARPHIDRLIKFRVKRLRDVKDDVQHHIRDGHRKLRMLRAANGGDLARMHRVLSYAFGRRGKRRREFWDDFMYPTPVEINRPMLHPKRPADAAPIERTPDFLDRWDEEKLRAFLKSQNAHMNALGMRRIGISLKIPTESAWGLPLVPELARNKRKRQWAKVAEKIMPPIPKAEWEMLRDIVDNKASKEVFYVPTRRPVAQSPDNAPTNPGWNWMPYVIKPVHLLDSQASRNNRLLSGVVDENTPTGEPPVRGCHNYTPRLWRRLFSSIWQLTAYMEKTPGSDKWNIVWGRFPTPAKASPKTVMGFMTDAKRNGTLVKGQWVPSPAQQAFQPSNPAQKPRVRQDKKDSDSIVV